MKRMCQDKGRINLKERASEREVAISEGNGRRGGKVGNWDRGWEKGCERQKES